MERTHGSFAILGTRGVPPRYGGFETFAAELSSRLVTRGHEVTVYCRRTSEADAPVWKGVRRVELPSIRHKYLETVSHAFLSSLHALGQSYDAVLVCNAANAFVLPLLAAARIPTAVNVDGIERNRRKWNALGRAVYTFGELMSVRYAGRIVADAEMIASYYRERHAASTTVIPYGAGFPVESDSAILGRLGVLPGEYLLYVSRFEPENNPLEVVREYRGVGGSLPLVMVGDAPYSRELISQVRTEADPRVILPGGVYDVDYRTLQRNALLYIQATEIGGTHPALIEAMASGGMVLANGTSENREVGGDAVLYFDIHEEGSLAREIKKLLDDRGTMSVYREEARKRARILYDWDTVTRQYEGLLREIDPR